MKKTPVSRIHDLVGLLHALYPPGLAEEWDNVGLQVGDPSAAVRRVLIALDPSAAALAASEAAGAQVLLTHHPLILRPLRNLVPQDEAARVVCDAIRRGVAVLAAHTNLDRAHNGLNDWLASCLGLAATQPLALGPPGGASKLVVFVPAGYEGPVAEALFAAGAGTVGGYDRCSFATTGFGTFRAGVGSNPFLGTVGATTRTPEVRLETIVPAEALQRVLTRMLKAHPYEEVAYDLIPLGNRRGDVGLGRIGRLDAPLLLVDFVRQVETRLATRARFCGDPQRAVSKIAVCGGSGASLLAEAERQGADVLVTGDVKYHEARSAEARGVALIDAGHFATERIAVPGLANALRAAAGRRGLALEFIEMSGEQDPFAFLPSTPSPEIAAAATSAAARGKPTGGRRAGTS